MCAYVIDLKPCLTVQSIQCYKKQRTHGKETLLICNYVEFDFRLKNKKSTYRSPKAEYILGTYILKQNHRWWGVGRGRTTKQVFWFQTEKANAKQTPFCDLGTKAASLQQEASAMKYVKEDSYKPNLCYSHAYLLALSNDKFKKSLPMCLYLVTRKF
jgi:hypothetical protein